MENSLVLYEGNISYHLQISYQDKSLHLHLTTKNDTKTYRYSKQFQDNNLPPELLKEAKGCGNIFKMLQNRKNFQVDPVNGIIHVILIKPTFIEDDQHIEKRIGLQLEAEGNPPILSLIDSVLKIKENDSTVSTEEVSEEYTVLSSETLFQTLEDFDKEMKVLTNQFKFRVLKCPTDLYEYSDGFGSAEYRGQVKWNNKFHGVGMLNYKNGVQYIGQWENGLMHGKGVMYMLNQAIQVYLQTHKGLLEGRAVYHYSGGMKLEGTFSKNKQVGKWRIIKSTGSVIEEDGEKLQVIKEMMSKMI